MMRENQRLLNQLHVFTDGLAVFLAMLVSYWLRFSLFRGVRGMPLNYYIWLGVVAAALTLAVFAVAGLYESFRTVRFHMEASRVAALELLVSLIVMAAIYVLRLGETSRWTVVFFYAVSTLLLTGKRAAMRLLLRRCRAMGYNQKRVLLVGHGEGAEAYLTRVAMDKNLGFRVIGYVAERGCWDALPYCGSYEELDAIFASEKPDEVVVALPTEEGRWMGRIINACEKDGTKLSVVPSYVRYMPANPQFDSVNGLPLINLRRIPLDNLGNAFLKRAADIICSLVLIILTSPLMLIAAIGVKLSSPGPIIFRQERVGKDKKPALLHLAAGDFSPRQTLLLGIHRIEHLVREHLPSVRAPERHADERSRSITALESLLPVFLKEHLRSIYRQHPFPPMAADPLSLKVRQRQVQRHLLRLQARTVLPASSFFQPGCSRRCHPQSQDNCRSGGSEPSGLRRTAFPPQWYPVRPGLRKEPQYSLRGLRQ